MEAEQNENVQAPSADEGENLNQKAAGTSATFRPRPVFVALVALLVLILDQASKYAVTQWLGWGGSWTAFPDRPGLLTIVTTMNTGAVCGYFPQTNIIFTFAPFLILAIVILFYRQQREPGWLLSIGTGLIIGGAIGNLIDRIRYGFVVDFVQVSRWPVFNVSDAAVSTAVVLLLLWSLREEAGTTARDGGAAAASRASVSWKLMLSFLVLLGILAVLGVVVCVLIPQYLYR
ncbi:MAG: signal peptidase II [Rudaea sp.]